MATLENSARLTKRALLTNLFTPAGLAVTPLLSGSHGIGKSMIVHSIAKDLGGTALVIEGGSLKEGELTGLPFQATGDDGKKEVNFVPHFQIAKIQRLQKHVYESAIKGLLGGDVKLDPETSTEYYKDASGEHIIAKSAADRILAGDVNAYAFGEELPGEIKLKLLSSGEVTPVIIMIDEMNRTDQQTMKEMMNIVLTRNINGYNLPWWAFFVSAINPCGQDSIYSTNEMDAAQIDRFLKINVSADLNEWLDYAIDKADAGNGLDPDYVTAMSNSPDVFNSGEFKSNSDEEIDATPRSHEICAYIYHYADIINMSKFFTPAERAKCSDDVRMLINDKIGSRAGRTILSAIKNKENFVNPEDILTLAEREIKPAIADKIAKMRPIAQRFLAKSVLRYIQTNVIAYHYISADKSAANSAVVGAKEKIANFNAQLKQFVTLIGEVNSFAFFKEGLTATGKLPDENKYAKQANARTVASFIISCASNDIIEQIRMMNNVNIDK